jgi:predicted transcriptional regulator
VSKKKKPTAAELAILRVLWARGPSTVREVAVAMGRDEAYTTVLKLMQIMTEKGLISRDAATRAHVYSAVSSEEHTQRQLVADLLDRVFDGSASRLLMQALAARQASPEELRAIRRLIATAQSTRGSKKKDEP